VKKLKRGCTLFAQIEERQHKALRELAFKERKSMADLVREALGALIEKKSPEKK
jgi:hypothetical protein